MLYAVICYNSESVVGAWSKEKDDAVMEHHQGVMAKFAAQGKLGPVARLMPTTTATTVRTGREMVVLDGPFAETKEQMLGFYLFDCDTLDEVIAAARELVSEPGCMEIRPVRFFHPGVPAVASQK
ncbi:YciI family protein [Steroidobacter sp.]|uniref:YciI family protein n=1 Tax=Steroidobacter sp. TaxID=1978227 RepID=UPI001A4FD40E|nr:YciI family protein [Steroidobacter sp.]MBL8271341.1 YciI family protein [Steroidobacter sp.]